MGAPSNGGRAYLTPVTYRLLDEAVGWERLRAWPGPRSSRCRRASTTRTLWRPSSSASHLLPSLSPVEVLKEIFPDLMVAQSASGGNSRARSKERRRLTPRRSRRSDKACGCSMCSKPIPPVHNACRRASPVHRLHPRLVVASASGYTGRYTLLDAREVLFSEGCPGGRGVLLRVLASLGAGDRCYVLPPGEEPREGELPCRCVLFAGSSPHGDAARGAGNHRGSSRVLLRVVWRRPL